LEYRHSTGRGGYANFTASPTPPVESPPPHREEFISTGRGGAGNITRSREQSKVRQGDGDVNAPLPHGHAHGLAGKLMDKLIHPHAHEAERIERRVQVEGEAT
jgi:hypothetical protein